MARPFLFLPYSPKCLEGAFSEVEVDSYPTGWYLKCLKRNS